MQKNVNQTEDRYFRQFKAGNEAAFEYFFKKYYNRILGFIRQFVYNEQDSKEITQEVFIKLWTSRSNFRKANGLQSFVYKTARNQCLNFLRHQDVQHKYTSFYLQQRENRLNKEILDSIEFDSMTFEELDTLIQKSISELPEKCRDVFIKKRFENKKNKEIAYEMGITSKAVEANMTRALKFLKVRVANYLTIFLFLIYCHFLLK